MKVAFYEGQKIPKHSDETSAAGDMDERLIGMDGALFHYSTRKGEESINKLLGLRHKRDNEE